MSVRIGLHEFVLYKSLNLALTIDSFVEHQIKWNHRVNDNVRINVFILNPSEVCVMDPLS